MKRIARAHTQHTHTHVEQCTIVNIEITIL
jgi:hypothetical protein